MTSGGYRTVSSRTTVARFRKHVSPLTGVVSRLERIEADLPLNTNYHAAHKFSAPAETVNELRAGLSGGSFGKGSTAEQGEASALMEAIERYSGIFQGDEIRVTRRFSDFASGEAIPPNQVLLFSDTQYRRGLAPTPGSDDSEVPAPLNPSAEIEWSPVWSLRDERFKYLPTSLLYFFYRGPGTYQIHAVPTAARPATRWRRRSSRDFSSWWNAMPTQSGGTIDRSGRKWTSASSTIPTSAICEASSAKPDADFGCSTSPAISAFRPLWR
jgi:oxazoline/thiazoline synthase